MPHPDYVDRQKYQKQIKQLEQQNQKLREALENIADFYVTGSERTSTINAIKSQAQQALDEVDKDGI